MALIDGQRGVGARAPRVTSDAAAWRPGMTFVSPVTGRRTTNAADVPGTAEYQARQNQASSARYAVPKVATHTPSAPRTAATSRTLGSRAPAGPTPAQQAASAAAAAQRAAQASANNAARSNATSARNAAQSKIDAATAQKQVNQGKLDALAGLVNGGLQGGRDNALKSIDRDLSLLLKQALQNFDSSVAGLNQGLRDNESSENDSSFGNLANRARETQDVVGAALANGAGESDVLRTQLQSLRNWASNQGEINRGYFDTVTSTNSGITDLNVGTRSNMTGYELDANQRRGGIWSDFYEGMADSFTQKDNLAGNQFLLDKEIASHKGEQSEQDRLIAHINAGGNADTFKVQAQAAQTGTYDGGFAKKAAEWAGKTWENPGVSATTAEWEGQATVDGQLNSTQAWSAAKNTDTKGASKKRPEGATLRKW